MTRGSFAPPSAQPNGQRQQWSSPHEQANVVQYCSTASVAHSVASPETIAPDYNDIDQFDISYDQIDYRYFYFENDNSYNHSYCPLYENTGIDTSNYVDHDNSSSQDPFYQDQQQQNPRPPPFQPQQHRQLFTLTPTHSSFLGIFFSLPGALHLMARFVTAGESGSVLGRVEDMGLALGS